MKNAVQSPEYGNLSIFHPGADAPFQSTQTANREHPTPALCSRYVPPFPGLMVGVRTAGTKHHGSPGSREGGLSWHSPSLVPGLPAHHFSPRGVRSIPSGPRGARAVPLPLLTPPQSKGSCPRNVPSPGGLGSHFAC